MGRVSQGSTARCISWGETLSEPMCRLRSASSANRAWRSSASSAAPAAVASLTKVLRMRCASRRLTCWVASAIKPQAISMGSASARRRGAQSARGWPMKAKAIGVPMMTPMASPPHQVHQV